MRSKAFDVDTLGVTVVTVCKAGKEKRNSCSVAPMRYLFLTDTMILKPFFCKKFNASGLQVSRYAPEEFRPSCPRNSFA
ncbi:hypothetical protein [Rickettsiella endosymbiont of Dermanyssus gallinae]|uniref:hypothetical protein n=1 Tax=Rickettsiella endosymbiont of Dermanyssus gallinae TaxID=2856608 RepID=UPI001C52883E|nr:hypothetical protein [Rickettsiella endosymbiont of Dermanyssus gallinae]